MIVKFFSLSVISTMSQRTQWGMSGEEYRSRPQQRAQFLESLLHLWHTRQLSFQPGSGEGECDECCDRGSCYDAINSNLTFPTWLLNNALVHCDEGCELCTLELPCAMQFNTLTGWERERDTSQQRQAAPGAKSAHIIPLRHLAGALLLIISALVYIWGGFNKFRINPSQWQLMAVTISLKC